MKATILLLILSFSQSVLAGFDFAPIIASVAPSGQAATTSFTVTNLDATKLPVQISIVPREPDLDGKEVYKENPAVEEMFRIFPNQMVLDPKSSRTVRVTYIGKADVKAELSFRIIAEELPVDLDDPKKKYTKPIAKITMSTRYVGSLYVTPKAAKPEIIIEGKKSETASNNLILDITNKGTAHQIYRKPTVKIQSLLTGKEVVLSENDTRPLMSQNILAGRSRRYSLPWPKDLAAGPMKVTIDAPKE